MKREENRFSQSVGTRNILVHEYDKVDYQKVYDSVSDCLRDYHQCEYILGLLNEEPCSKLQGIEPKSPLPGREGTKGRVKTTCNTPTLPR